MSSLREVPSARYQPTWAWVVLGVLTALGFALRLSGHDQSLGGDEYYTQTVITASDGVVSLLRHVRDSYETTPPLYYLLGWLARKWNPSLTAIRIPSLLAGTALVPSVYFLARRMAGWRAGLTAAALVSISPFGIWYSNEARAYALLALLCSLVMLQALRFVERPNWLNSLLLVAASTAALYTHNTAVFCVLAVLAWVFLAHGELRGRAVAIGLATAAFYVPFLLTFEPRDVWWMFGHIYGRGPEIVWTGLERMVLGSAYVPLRVVPGATGLVVVSVCVAVGAFTQRKQLPAARSPITLALTVVITTIAAVYTYAMATNTNIFVPRSMNCMFAAALVLLASAVARAVPGKLAAVLSVATLAVFGWSTATAFQAGWQRSDVKGAITTAAALKPQPRVVMSGGYRLRNYLPSEIADATIPKELTRSQWAQIGHSFESVAWVNSLLPTGITRAALESRRQLAHEAGFSITCSKLFPGYPPVLLQVASRPGVKWVTAPACSAADLNRAMSIAPVNRRNVRVLPAGSSTTPTPSDLLLLVALVALMLGFLAWLLLGANHKLTRHGRQAFLG